MKNIILSGIFLLTFFNPANAQTENKSRKELRQEKQEQKKEEINNLLNRKAFVFKPSHAIPMGGGSIYLNHSYDAIIKGDTLISFLPFYGVAYRVEYGARNSALDFTQPVKEYSMEKEEEGYKVVLDVKNKMDYLTYNFHISDNGNATLSVTSTNRQAITFYGEIEPPEETQ